MRVTSRRGRRTTAPAMPSIGPPGPRRADRGSVLMLVPAGLLIVFVLASITVDMSLVHLRKRQAFDLASAAANDAASAGADPARLRSGAYVLDPEATARVVERAVGTSELAAYLAEPPRTSITRDGVRVEVSLEADYIFAGALPGAPDGTVVTASATAAADLPP
jgi:hypothetical protein